MNDHFLDWIDEERLTVAPKAGDVFLRFGQFHRNGRSYNHHTREKEVGLSVFPATLNGGVVELNDAEMEQTALDRAVILRDRCAIPVTGRIVGYGSDGEPLLRRVKLLNYAVGLQGVQEIYKQSV